MRTNDDFNVPQLNIGVQSRTPLMDVPYFSPMVSAPIDIMHCLGGIIKAFVEYCFAVETTKKPTNISILGPVITSTLLEFLYCVHERCTVPKSFVRKVNMGRMSGYKTKDYKSFFLTSCAIAIDNIHNYSTNTPKRELEVYDENGNRKPEFTPAQVTMRKKKFASMFATLHLLVLMICHQDAHLFVDEINI